MLINLSFYMLVFQTLLGANLSQSEVKCSATKKVGMHSELSSALPQSRAVTYSRAMIAVQCQNYTSVRSRVF